MATLEDLEILLQNLYTNMDNLDALYYNMFINTVPMTLTLKRYDANGILQTYELPNRAKDRTNIQQGHGNPTGVITASVGVFYLDVDNFNVYYKSVGTDAYGWVLIKTSLNFQAGVDYVAPNGDGSQLINVNATHITSGMLSPVYGGTGANSISGLIKGNGSLAATAAIVDTDYIAPNELTGTIIYSACVDVPVGFLPCYGSQVSKTTYARLYSCIGDQYNTGSEATGYFSLPDLRGVFIRGYDAGKGVDTNRTFGSSQSSAIPNIYGKIDASLSPISANAFGETLSNYTTFTGPFEGIYSTTSITVDSGTATHMTGFTFNATKCSSVYQDGVSEARPINIALLPMIKY
jgi:microcystin-dependent protein